MLSTKRLNMHTNIWICDMFIKNKMLMQVNVRFSHCEPIIKSA